MSKSYTASKSRSQGRDSWSVIFRHPVRLDPSGKPGRRVRRGLGTSDEAEADRLVGELNEILRSNELWEPSARSGAESRFDARVLDIFYDGIEPVRLDSAAVRDEFLPLPGPEKDYRSVLMLGTTGAGKTTLVRQLLGTDPATERFPSTSTAKTTVADTELIFDPSPEFRAVVTFVGRDEVVDYLTECVSEAALAVFRQAGDREIYGGYSTTRISDFGSATSSEDSGPKLPTTMTSMTTTRPTLLSSSTKERSASSRVAPRSR